jgi:hypothetical protein
MVSAISRNAVVLHFSRVGFLSPVHGLGVEASIELSPYHPPCFSWSFCIGDPVKYESLLYRHPRRRMVSSRSAQARLGPSPTGSPLPSGRLSGMPADRHKHIRARRVVSTLEMSAGKWAHMDPAGEQPPEPSELVRKTVSSAIGKADILRQRDSNSSRRIAPDDRVPKSRLSKTSTSRRIGTAWARQTRPSVP